MKAYICDRCGNTYLENHRIPTFGRISGSYLAGFKLISKDGDVDGSVDLCDDCLECLQDFMSNKTERTESA